MLEAKLYVSTISSPTEILVGVHCRRRGGGRDGGGLGIRRIEGDGMGAWSWDEFKKRGTGKQFEPRSRGEPTFGYRRRRRLSLARS